MASKATNDTETGDIITAKLPRMFRSALDALVVLAKLKAQGVSLQMIAFGDVTATASPSWFFTILSAVAQAERDRIRERVATVRQIRRRVNAILAEESRSGSG
jgi:putative DNA-invertase from lambdoid prophage Rac